MMGITWLDGRMADVGLSRRTRLAVGAVGAALGLGVLGDGLLRVWPWGINAGLWTLAAVLAVIGVAWWAGQPLEGGGRWLVLPLLTFASFLAWRDSPVLTALNLLAVVVCLVLAALYTRAGQIRVGGLIQHAIGGMLVGVMSLVGALILVFDDVRWGELRGPRGWGPALAVVRGVLVAAPVLLVFGGLLMAADAAFAGLANRLFHWDLAEAAVHLTVVGMIAWPVAGVLRQLLLSGEWSDPLAERPSFVRLGTIEMGMVLGSLDLLFLAFVLVQFRYFFGGASLVETSAILTYSEYARRGFFELVYVAMFALPLLLLVHWTIPFDRPQQERWFRVLAGVMIALLFIIMLSALQRMRLYTEEFGLTELRLYPTAFMGWLALVFVWLGATVMRGRRALFPFGALVAGFLVLGALNALSPDELIARVNVGRGDVVRPVDGRYLGDLSADAVPALVENLSTLSPEARPRMAAVLLRRWTPPREFDWRTANWSRTRAWEAVASRLAQLEALAQQTPQR